MQTAVPLASKMPAVAPCLSSERQAAQPKQGGELAKTTRSKARGCEQGSEAKLCPFCLANILTATARCRHCTSVHNHAEWRRRGGRHISTASRTTGCRRQTVGGPVGPSTDKNNEHKEARLDGQRPQNQRTRAQRARMQGQSSKGIASTAETASRRQPRRDSHRTGTRRTSHAMPRNGQSGR